MTIIKACASERSLPLCCLCSSYARALHLGMLLNKSQNLCQGSVADTADARQATQQLTGRLLGPGCHGARTHVNEDRAIGELVSE